MSVTWFAAFTHKAALSDADRARLDPVLAATPTVSRTSVHRPASTHNPYLGDGRTPALVLEVYFDDAAGLNGAQGHRQTLATPDALPSLRGAAATQQVMRVRGFSVTEARQSPAMCSHLVAHEGEADDRDAWVAHHTTHQTAIVAHVRHIREIEVDVRLCWRGALSWPRVNHMLTAVIDLSRLTVAVAAPQRGG